jgi:predicted ATP-grasp superfamily ATP-dependent carboligase
VSSNTHIDYRPAVVVLNLHYTGLGVARALHGTGVEVWGLSFDDTFIGNHSRHCRFVRYPNPASDPRNALEFFRAFAARFERPPLLLPTRDLDLEFLLANRAEIESRYVLRLAPTEVLERVLDKSRLVAVARELGIACPTEVRVTRAADLERARDAIGLPCIVKPAVTARWRHAAILAALHGRKVVTFERWEELTDFYEQISKFDPEMLVQEYIPGTDEDLAIFGSYVAPGGELLRYFTARKVLQAPPGSGTGIVVQALPIPEIVRTSKALLAALGMSGISEIEYKRDPRNGRYVLIEINTRHWDQHLLGAAAGVNLTRALYADLVGDQVPPMEQDARPVSWIAEEGYLVGLKDALRGRGYPLSQYLRPLGGRKTWATLAWSDPLPSAQLARRVLGEYARGAAAATRRLFVTRPRTNVP